MSYGQKTERASERVEEGAQMQLGGSQQQAGGPRRRLGWSERRLEGLGEPQRPLEGELCRGRGTDTERNLDQKVPNVMAPNSVGVQPKITNDERGMIMIN